VSETKNEEKVKNVDLFMMWGFIFFVLGALGVIQMGFLEGHSNYVLSGLLLILIGIVILVSTAVIDKFKS
jgi:hypothetical protein